MPGDVNGDGVLSIQDLTMLIDALLGSVPSGYDPVAADVDCDGHVTVNDVTALIDHLISGK
jgi:hypothetical protein